MSLQSEQTTYSRRLCPARNEHEIDVSTGIKHQAMPLRKNYPQDYVDQCKLRVKQQLGTCRDLIAATTPHKTQGREDQRRSRVLRASFAVMGNAHVIGCVLPLGRAIKLRYAFNHSAAIVLYLRTGSSTAAAISSDFSPQSALKKPSQPEAIAVRLRIMPATRKRHGVWNSISTGSPGPRVRPA